MIFLPLSTRVVVEAYFRELAVYLHEIMMHRRVVQNFSQIANFVDYFAPANLQLVSVQMFSSKNIVPLSVLPYFNNFDLFTIVSAKAY